MQTKEVCLILKNLLQINLTLEVLIDSPSFRPSDKVIRSMVNLQPQVNDWAFNAYNQLSINENVPGFMEIDITKETAETLFKKLQLEDEFLDFVNINDYRDKSIKLQSELENIIFQMNQLSLDDDDVHVSFLECAEPYSYELVELFEKSMKRLEQSDQSF